MGLDPIMPGSRPELNRCATQALLDSFLIDMIYHTDRFANVEPPLHPRDEFHLVMMDNPFNVLLDSISQDLVEDFGVHIH